MKPRSQMMRAGFFFFIMRELSYGDDPEIPDPLDYDYSYDYNQCMKTVSKNVLKAKMLEYFREVERTGEELIVTDHNKPVLRVIPIKPAKTVEDVFLKFRGKVKYYEDIRLPTNDECIEI